MSPITYSPVLSKRPAAPPRCVNRRCSPGLDAPGGARPDPVQRAAHQVGEVAAVELRLLLVGAALHRFVETLEGIPPALGVRIVGAEHADVRAALLDDPTGRL